jgi:hypothetical protein
MTNLRRKRLLVREEEEEHQQLQLSVQVPATTTTTSLSVGPTGPLLDLFTSMVELELVSLGGTEPLSQPAARKVHFSGFDGSSINPPVDVLLSSAEQQLVCIPLLQKALGCIQDLLPEEEQERNSTTIAQLDSLVSFLSDLSCENQQACAASIPYFYPFSRVAKAAWTFAHDFKWVAKRLLLQGQQQQQLMAATINSPRHHPLLLEKRLVNSCGQVIRYTLRTIFNPIPERARFAKTTHLGFDCLATEGG